MAGLIQASSISGSLDAASLAMEVLTQANDLSGISRIFRTVQVPNLVDTIAITKPGSVAEDVEELEVTEIENGTFTYVTFDLKKDRVKLARSDEAKYKSRNGDPLALQKFAAAGELARTLDKKAVAALETTPQTGATAGAWSTVTNSPLIDIATAIAAIKPFKADFCVMPSAVWAKYIATNIIGTLGTGNPGVVANALGAIPVFNIPIFVDENCTAKTCTVGSAAALGAVIGQGPVEVREEDVMSSGARTYQMDVFRQVKAPIYKNSSDLNAAVYEITAVIA